MSPLGSPSTDPTEPVSNRRSFWQRHPGLVWSNRDAPDDAFISAALHKNRFLELLDIAREFGPARVRQVWQRELAEGDIPAWFVAKVDENLEIIEQARMHAHAPRSH
jgi:hypothetical protein